MNQEREFLFLVGFREFFILLSNEKYPRKTEISCEFLVTTKANFVCRIGQHFQISLIYAFIGVRSPCIESLQLCMTYVLDAATSSGILKAKQKLGRTFNSDKLGGIALTKISKLTMCSAQEEAQAIVPASTGQHRHCTCSVLKIL